jgi:hypothetical protein
MGKTRRGKVLRVQVGFMLAFYALAVSRGLIPGLCATQNALDESTTLQTASSCCAHAAPAGAGPAIAASQDVHCAFCSLLSITAHSVQTPVVATAPGIAQPLHIDGRPAPDLAVTHDPNQRRGPPAIA